MKIKKEWFKKIVVMMLCVTFFQVTVFAKEKIDVTVNGQILEFDQDPIAEEGRTLVPMRTIFESLNAVVEWDGETQTVTAKKHSTEIKLTLGSNIAEINGEKYELDVPAKAVNNRTLVPARFVAEALKCDVKWNADTNTVIIKNGKKLVYSDNLFDIDKATYGYYMPPSGKSTKNSVYAHSDFMKVTAGETVYFTNYRVPCEIGFVIAYDSNKKVIKDKGASYVNRYVVPENVEYIVVSVNKQFASALRVSTNNDSDGYINDEICVADGRTVRIYAKQLISKKRDDLTFSWDCKVGQVNGNDFIINGNKSEIGEYPLKVTATDKNGKIVWAGESTVKIVDSNIKKIKFLAIGDSITNNKPWLSLIKSYSKNNISLVGTKGNEGLKHEGRSGYSSQTYHEGKYENPFFDGTGFNFKYYKETTGIDPDVVQIFLGTNNIQDNPEKNVGNIIKMIDNIRNEDANIPIFVVNSVYRGPLSDAGLHLKIFNLMEKLGNDLVHYENVYIVPAAISHDSENNYDKKDQVHPIDAGYTQMADCIFSSLCAHID